MAKKNWTEITELLGIVAIVGSLIFLALQIKQSQDIALNDRSYSSVDNRQELNLAIADHARIWQIGNVGGDLDEVESIVYSKLIENQHWISGSSWLTASRFDLVIGRDVAVADFAGFLHANPGALKTWRRYLASRESVRHALVSGYEPNPFQKAVEAKLTELSSD